MAKEIILYNLADNVTDEQYKDFVTKEKGPLLDSLSSVKKFELVKIVGAATGEIPYKYVGILHLSSLDEFYQKDAPSQKFQDFLAKWKPMTSSFHILFGEEIY
ncbi:MAG: hypothetical protein A2025_03400 [Chloroflexi bacterium RBG_19FT_COMBO_47_15]|nr:MAG: hypothetical protein A2025_03400 [Chloroflexi bacterium RBG_19FT_COMBO_47_15]